MSERNLRADLRFYWSPQLRWVWYAFATFAVSAFVTIYAVGHPTPAWLAWPIAAWFAPFMAWSVWAARAAGVRETPTGISWRSMAWRGFRGDLAWTDMRGFAYVFAPVRRTLVVELADGTRKIVWPTAPIMRWKGGQCYDLAAELTKRARAFDAPIEKYHTLGLIE